MSAVHWQDAAVNAQPEEHGDRAAATHPRPSVDGSCPDSSVAGAGQVRPLYLGYAIALLALVNLFNYMDRMALAVLLPSIKADLSLSDGQLGLLVGFAFFFFYAVCGIPIARWADRGIRRNIIALALVFWSVMTALSGAAQNFWQLFLARVGMGAGEAGCLPPAQSIICDYVPVRRRSGVFAIHSFGLFAGMVVGMSLAGSLADRIGWRWTFVALGVPGIALALVVRLTLREPTRGGMEGVQHNSSQPPLRTTAALLWRCATYRLITATLVLSGFAQFGLNQWWPSFYVRTFDLSLSTVGIYLGIAIGAGSAVGLLIGGFISNKLAQRDVKLPLVMGAFAIMLALPSVFGSLLAPSAEISMMFACLAMVFWSLPSGAAVSASYSVVQPRMRATAGAISIFLISLMGFGFGPFCVGILSDFLTTRYGAEALRYSLLVPACFIPLAAVAMWMSAQRLPADLRAVSAHADQDPQSSISRPVMLADSSR